MTAKDERGEWGGTEPDQLALRVGQDHRTLRLQLDAIEVANIRTAVLASLLALPKMLTEHFALEEQSDGLYDDLRMRRPATTRQSDALCDGHAVILDVLDERCRRLKQRIEAEREIGEIAEPIRREVRRWLEKPRRRDHDESCMICDVCYTDEGGYGQSPGCPERQEATARSQCPN